MKFPQSRFTLLAWHRHYLFLAGESRRSGNREAAAHLSTCASDTRRNLMILFPRKTNE